jgi:hypothetical protein
MYNMSIGISENPRMRRLKIGALVFGWIVVTAAQGQSQDWADASAEKLCKSVCQARDETWRTIPWQTDLIDAQRLAVAQSKPIFIWAMDGHPLGCT